MSERRIDIHAGALVIEMDTNIGIALCRFDNRCIECRSPDRVDALFRIYVVRREMQRPGFVMDHPAAHWNRVSQRFISNPDLFERVNAACRNRQVNRASPNDISFVRVSAPLVKIHFVSAPSEICREQPSCQSAADQNKSCHAARIYESGKQESRKNPTKRYALAISRAAS